MRSTEFLLFVCVCAASAQIIAGSNDNDPSVREAISFSIFQDIQKPNPKNCDGGRKWSDLVRRCVLSTGNNLF
jgi:hypothetical protein